MKRHTRSPRGRRPQLPVGRETAALPPRPPPVGRFARNALTEGWSNGQSEGHINRLKTLKRAMYGRAGAELPRRVHRGGDARPIAFHPLQPEATGAVATKAFLTLRVITSSTAKIAPPAERCASLFSRSASTDNLVLRPCLGAFSWATTC